MGIISFFKDGVKEMAIARPDEFKGLVVYKHPDPTIPMKAQLTVEADELALFCRRHYPGRDLIRRAPPLPRPTVSG